MDDRLASENEELKRALASVEQHLHEAVGKSLSLQLRKSKLPSFTRVSVLTMTK
jgi:hypothetical protein